MLCKRREHSFTLRSQAHLPEGRARRPGPRRLPCRSQLLDRQLSGRHAQAGDAPGSLNVEQLPDNGGFAGELCLAANGVELVNHVLLLRNVETRQSEVNDGPFFMAEVLGKIVEAAGVN